MLPLLQLFPFFGASSTGLVEVESSGKCPIADNIAKNKKDKWNGCMGLGGVFGGICAHRELNHKWTVNSGQWTEPLSE
jgi:hypothetical protein